MARARGMLLSLPSGWRILSNEDGEITTASVAGVLEPESIVLLLEQLVNRWPRGAELTIGIGADSILAVPLMVGAVQGRTQQELLYEIEGSLPWSAEDALACPMDNTAAVLRFHPWQNLLSELEHRNFQVKQLLPLAWICEQVIRQELHLNATSSLLFENEEGVHFFCRSSQAFESWKFWPVDSTSEPEKSDWLIAAEILASRPSDELIVSTNVSEALVQALKSRGISTEPREFGSASEFPYWSGMETIRRNSKAINFAVGRLSGSAPLDTFVRAAKVCCWSFIFLCLVSVSVMIVRARELQQLTRLNEREQIELFRETFPGVSVPQAIFARFESEHRKVLGQRGTGQQEEFPSEALNILKMILEAHSQPMRSRFEEIVIRNGRTEIECEFRNHEEATRMVGSLEKAGLEISPPQIQKIDEQRVGTRLRGQLRQFDPKAFRH